jgi:hypothetical protein
MPLAPNSDILCTDVRRSVDLTRLALTAGLV